MNQAAKPERFQSGAMKPNGCPLHVLLIEDDDDMRALLADAIRQEGWKVTECKNAFRWLQFCVYEATEATVRDGENYDVIVSDIRMPGMSGLDVMKTLNDLQYMRTCPPTILITAFGNAETHQQAENLGVAGVLDKPFAMRDLIAKILEVTEP